jgi:hypothetical protein
MTGRGRAPMTAEPPVPVGRDARFTLKAVPEAAARARALVEETLTDWGFYQLVPDAQLIASELMSNSIMVTPGEDLWLLLRCERNAVWVCVWDSSPVLPEKRAFKPHAESGRGMHIVAAVAAADGAFPVAEPRGKLTWARMET